MPLFDYSGFNAAGRKISGMIEGSGRRVVVQQLKARGIIATDLTQRTETVGPERRSIFRRSRVPASELAAVTRQLATLLAAGVPLEEAIATVTDQQEMTVLTGVLSESRELILQGKAMHEALARRPNIFSPLFINMVKVGESSGSLDQSLGRLADYLERRLRVQSRIQSALAYPMLMLMVGGGVLFFLLTSVVPRVTRMLEEMEQLLPLPTRMLIIVSDFFSSNWWIIIVVLTTGTYFLLRYIRTAKGRILYDRLMLQIPVFGRLNLNHMTAHFAGTMATLLKSGVPLLTTLQITRNLMENRILRQALDQTIESVNEGEGMATPLEKAGVFPRMAIRMVSVGEKSCKLEEMLVKLAETYDQQTDAEVNTLLSLLEPLMILLMGITVGFIVLAVLLPIFQASQGLG